MDQSTSHEVSIEAIEASKENVQPLSTGRSASKLQSLLSSDRKSVDAQLKQGHADFENEINTVAADPDHADPLDVYHRYDLSLSSKHQEA